MKKLPVLFLLVLMPLWAAAQVNSHTVEDLRYWSGSGIALDATRFATNYHVVKGARHLSVYFPLTETSYRAETVASNPEHDLAVVRVTDPAFKGFPDIRYGFKTKVEDVGTGVFVLGYPLTSEMGEEVKLTTGIVSARTGYKGSILYYQVTAPIQPGNSGGPLFNDRGELIGIVSSKLQGTGYENVTYAIKLGFLSILADDFNMDLRLERRSRIASRKLNKQCKAIIPCTVLVYADNQDDYTPPESFGVPGKYPIHVNQPTSDSSVPYNIRIMGLELTEEFTAFYLSIINYKTDALSFSVGRDTFVKDRTTGKTCRLTSAEEVSLYPETVSIPPGSQQEFVLRFPPIPATSKILDLYEEREGGIRISGIRIFGEE